ncbi:MAG TPA: sulfotransferase [Casimicrobiaceae bacterium]|nr:sulfotransferase [Casimicrobiaceae bacterium]
MQTATKPARNQRCPCGSGLKYKHCCSRLAEGGATADTGRSLQQAYELHQRGFLPEAAARYTDLLRKQPRNAQARYLLGHVRFLNRDFAAAIGEIGQAIRDGLSDAAAPYYLGLAHVELGQLEAAARAFESAVRLKPEFEEARNNLGNVYYTLHDYERAQRTYADAIARNPTNWHAWHNLGHVHYVEHRVDEAIDCFRKALAVVPNHAEVRASLATLLEVDNAVDEAGREAQAAIESDPNNASAKVVIAKVLRRSGRCTEALAMLDGIDVSTTTRRAQVSIASERGDNLDRLARHDEAFVAYAQAKQALIEVTGTRDYDVRNDERLLDDIETFFDAETVAALSSSLGPPESQDIVPIFVVGFPRTGTTLLEQMLSSHSRIASAGELETLGSIENALAARTGTRWPYCLDKLDAGERIDWLREARRTYLGQLRQARRPGPLQRLVIDKLPFNMLRLPLIEALFPGASVIHMLRHPLDTVLSAYFQVFLRQHAWSHRLVDAASMYVRTSRHVDRIVGSLALPNYRRLKYEDLIAEPETKLRGVLAQLGEPWEVACLEFHRNRRVARSASYAQVTRKLYSDSAGRHRHYLRSIDDVTMARLAPLCAELGYTIAP